MRPSKRVNCIVMYNRLPPVRASRRFIERVLFKGKDRQTLIRYLVVTVACVTVLRWLIGVAFSGSAREFPTYDSVSITNLNRTFMSDTCQKLMEVPYRPANPPQGRFTPHGVNTFLFISAHRVSARDFAVVGVTARGYQSEWKVTGDGCLWISYEGPHTIKGSLEFSFPGDHSFLPYEAIVIRCSLDRLTPADAGGTLFYHIHGKDVLVYKEEDLRPTTTAAAGAAAAAGAGDAGVADGAAAVTASDDDPPPTHISKRLINPPKPLPDQLTMCSFLIHEHVPPSRVSEHLQYLSFFGFDKFIFYDGGAVTHALQAAVRPFVNAGVLKIVQMEGLAELPVHHPVVLMNDCAYRTRFTSEWVVSLPFDEYPHAVGPHRLSSVLSSNAGRPWVTMGAYTWHIELCLPITVVDEWLQQRMVFRAVHPTCKHHQPSQVEGGTAAAADADDSASAAAAAAAALAENITSMCLGEAGSRRVMVDPRQVQALGAHACKAPSLGGVDLNTAVMHVNKFEHLLTPAALICEYHMMKGQEPHKYRRKMHLSRSITQGRQAGLIAVPS